MSSGGYCDGVVIASAGNRTQDLLLTKQMHYQLCYRGGGVASVCFADRSLKIYFYIQMDIPSRFPEYPQYSDAAWAEGCRRAKEALGAAWNGMNLRAKKMACAARIDIANAGLNRVAAQARAGSPGRGLGGRRRTRKSRKSRRHTRRAYF